MSTAVIAIFDIGKTNKKLFLFDQDYQMVYEKSAVIPETRDEDGDDCEDLPGLVEFVRGSVDELQQATEFDVKALNFSAYGASVVYIDERGNPLTPLYNYLKTYPARLQQQLYVKYGGAELFALQTASPSLGSLNAGLQLYRLKTEKPGLFDCTKWALHLPQYLGYLLTGTAVSDITSIGCHTALWDFNKRSYHAWVRQEGIERVLAPLVPTGSVYPSRTNKQGLRVGAGIHDSSAALVPYLHSFEEPFLLISTGTWCISLNPFDQHALSARELQNDCLCYLMYTGKPVKAARLFAGHEHDIATKKMSVYFNKPDHYYHAVRFDEGYLDIDYGYDENEMGNYKSYEEAYHRFMHYLVEKQWESSHLVLRDSRVRKIYVDGGFSNNDVYMNLLDRLSGRMEIYAASVPQASAIGAALVLHDNWNHNALPSSLIRLKKYSSNSTTFPKI